MAWQHSSPEVTVKCFKKYCVSNAVDGTDDNMLWNDSEEAGSVSSECQEDKGTDCGNGQCDTDWYRQIVSNMLCVLSV
jgi:hypothetical protein